MQLSGITGWVRTQKLSLLPTLFALVLSGLSTASARAISIDSSFGSAKYGFGSSPSGRYTLPNDAQMVGVAPDGKIIVAGTVYNLALAGVPQREDFAVVRFHADGFIDSSFGTSSNITYTNISSVSNPGPPISLEGTVDEVMDMKVQADGKIVVVGQISTSFDSTPPAGAVVRYTAAGDVDLSARNGGTPFKFILNDPVSAVVIQADGRILIGGSGTGPGVFIKRFEADGTDDGGFGAGGAMTVDLPGQGDQLLGLAIDSSGAIFGYGSTHESEVLIFRLDGDGVLDSAFGASGFADLDNGLPYGLNFLYATTRGGVLVDSQDRILAVGRSCGSIALGCGIGVIRLLPDGTVDTSYGYGGLARAPKEWGTPNHATISSDDRVLVASAVYATYIYYGVTQFGPEGQRYTEHGNSGIKGWPQSVAIQQDPSGGSDRALVAGSSFGGNGALAALRFSLDAFPEPVACPPTLQPSCIPANRAKLFYVATKPGKEKLKIDWKKLASATLASNFGNPVEGTTSYAACIYDDGGALVEEFSVDAAGLQCAGRDCWKPRSVIGYKFKDSDASSKGITNLGIASGPALRGSVKLQGKNNALRGQTELPSGLALALLGQTAPTVQLHASDGICVGATLDNVRVDTGTIYQAQN